MCLMAKVLIMTRQRGILLKDLLDQDRFLYDAGLGFGVWGMFWNFGFGV